MSNNNSELEKLKKGLYKKEGGILNKRLKRSKISTDSEPVKTFWAEEKKKIQKSTKEMIETAKPIKKSNKLAWFVLFIIFLFLLGSGFFVYFFGLGGKVISSKKIELSVDGPLLVESGESGRWYVSITNNNNAELELADLIIKYPESSLDIESKEIKQDRISLGKILPGQTLTEKLEFFILGERDEQKKIELTLEYRVAESNAIFAKEIDYSVQLSRSPVGIQIELPEEAEIGQEVTFNLEYVSNSDSLLKDIYIKMDYPPGFRFLESSLEPVFGNDLWKAGDLMPQEKRNLQIKGILEGQEELEVTFRALVGLMDNKNEFKSFDSLADSTKLKKTFFNLDFLVDGKDTDVISPGKIIVITVPWKNNLNMDIRDVSIEVKLAGDVFDKQNVSATKGYYDSYRNTVVWNVSTMPTLALIKPGQEGSVIFKVGMKDILPAGTAFDKNFTLFLEGQMNGYRTDEEGQRVLVKSGADKEMKINTEAQISSRLLYSSGAFVNSGPLPPKVGTETSYTVVWSVSSFYNDLTDVEVKAFLPPYVSWLGKTSPSDDNINYNSATGEVIWKPSIVEAGAGFSGPAKEISFQVSILPDINQLNNAPELVGRTSFEGKDSFTRSIIRDLSAILYTRSIPEYSNNYQIGNVVE